MYAGKNSSLVLIVDDSPDTLGMLNEALEKEGITTLVALEAKQAISIAQKMTPDVILLDAIMPGMDGFEACEKIKKDSKLKDIPVIFMTGLSDTESIVKGFAAGGVDYLTKPIKPQELIARIHVHLFNSRTALSAQSALDTTGQCIFAIDNDSKQLWATPAANQLLTNIDHQNALTKFEQELKIWLSHAPTKGNQFHFSTSEAQYTATYVGNSNDKEHFVRLIDDADADETTILKEYFKVTQREADVFLWITKGKTNREIAQILGMQPRTVNKHLEQLFKKLGVDNRTSAAGMGIQCLQKKLGV